MDTAITELTNAWRPPAPVPRAKILPPLALLRTLQRNPLEAWTAAHFEQRIVTNRLPFGQVVVLNEPSAIRHMLLENTANYRKDWLQRRVLSNGLIDGLLTAEADQWRAQRRTLSPLFTRRTVMNSAPAMLQAVDTLVANWRNSDGQIVEIVADVTRMTLDVLRHTIFSEGLGEDPEAFRVAMTEFFNAIGRIDPFDVLGLPNLLPRVGRWRARPSLRFFDAAVDTIIARRQQTLRDNPSSAPNDLLTLLLKAQDPETGHAMTESEVRANIITFISAGHETTANTLSWALYLVSQSPRWRDRVAEEATREFAGPLETLADRLVLTRAVIDETLRLYPPIAAISRTALGPDELAGVAVKRGTMVVVSPYVLHRHRTLWKDPDIFDPERFLNGGREKIDRYAYLPFGAGPRICIGATFALQEATITLASILRELTLELAPDAIVWPLLCVTVRPQNGLRMIVRSRGAQPRSAAETTPLANPAQLVTS
jgi:cytochrome P450